MALLQSGVPALAPGTTERSGDEHGHQQSNAHHCADVAEASQRQRYLLHVGGSQVRGAVGDTGHARDVVRSREFQKVFSTFDGCRAEALDSHSPAQGGFVPEKKNASRADTASAAKPVDRKALIGLLNEDLAREYQAIIAYVVYSQVLKGAAFMSIAEELEVHAKEELDHALMIAKQIDYLGGTPTVVPKPVKMSDDPKALLRFDLENENETIRQYRARVRQCEALGEFAMGEHIREILKAEQEHQIDLATALGEDPPNMTES